MASSLPDNNHFSPAIQVLLAPNAFKGSLEAPAICRILAEELYHPAIHTVSLPLGDGGDGTASIIASYLHARPVQAQTYDALGRKQTADYYIVADTAIIELAAICGLKDLLPEEYDILNASTAGLGIIIRHALEQEKIRKILLCIGGSASIDGGLGALCEIGLKIVKHGNLYKNHLIEIESIDARYLQQKFKNIELTILCDVDNTICGPEGASSIFGPQKGASPLQVDQLDQSLLKYAGLLLSNTGVDIITIRHGGAAGGIAASFAALLNAKLVSGAHYCIRLSGFENHLKNSGLVITGEGKLDSQSLKGKIPGAIATLCKERSIPLISIAGIAEANLSPLFGSIFSLSDYAGDITASLRFPERYLKMIAADIKKNILNLI